MCPCENESTWKTTRRTVRSARVISSMASCVCYCFALITHCQSVARNEGAKANPTAGKRELQSRSANSGQTRRIRWEIAQCVNDRAAVRWTPQEQRGAPLRPSTSKRTGQDATKCNGKTKEQSTGGEREHNGALQPERKGNAMIRHQVEIC